METESCYVPVIGLLPLMNPAAVTETQWETLGIKGQLKRSGIFIGGVLDQHRTVTLTNLFYVPDAGEF